MSYLRRTQKVSLGFLHDYFGCENTELQKVPGDKNDSDILTKGLDHVTHWRHVEALGLRPRLPSGSGPPPNQPRAIACGPATPSR